MEKFHGGLFISGRQDVDLRLEQQLIAAHGPTQKSRCCAHVSGLPSSVFFVASLQRSSLRRVALVVLAVLIVSASPRSASATAAFSKPIPHRIDGVFMGMTTLGGATIARVYDLQTPVFGGGGGALRLGQVLFPWMTIAVEGSGSTAFNNRQQLHQGGVLFEFGFLPSRYPLSLHAGVGFGAGFIVDKALDKRGGFGGPKFSGAIRYEWFPGARHRRPPRSGGLSLGPELGWRGFTPSSKGRPMAHTLYAGLWVGYYWGT